MACVTRLESAPCKQLPGGKYHGTQECCHRWRKPQQLPPRRGRAWPTPGPPALVHSVPASAARMVTSALGAQLARRGPPGPGTAGQSQSSPEGSRPTWGHVADGAELRHVPGGSWKRLTTLFSGVLKKAAAMELYSPSAQKSCKVGRENGPVGQTGPGLHGARGQPRDGWGRSWPHGRQDTRTQAWERRGLQRQVQHAGASPQDTRSLGHVGTPGLNSVALEPRTHP